MNVLNIKDILPYIGVDDVKFGMSRDEVASIWGVAECVRTNLLDEIVEFRNGISTTYSHENILVEIGLPKICTEVKLFDIPIFVPSKKSRLQGLLALDGDAWKAQGMIVFKNLGISITGFEHPDDSDLAMSVFSRGHWDDDFETMTRYQS